MVTYYCVYLLIFLSIIFKIGKSSTAKKRSQCIFLFLVLFSLLALRHPSMGVDLQYGSSYGYLGRFIYISELPWREVLFSPRSHYERGYILFNKVLSLFSVNQQILLVACAAASLGPIFYVMYRKSHSPAMSTLVYMGLSTFLMHYSGLRQSLALGICFLSILFIEDKRPARFAITVVLAMLFHYSAWVFLVAYPIYHFPMKRTWRLLTYLIPPVVYFFRHPLFRILSKLLKENARIDNNNAITLFLVFFLVYIFCCLFSGEEKEVAGLKNLFFTACCIQGLSGVNSGALRVGYYFMNSLILLLPMVTSRMRNRENARILNVVIGICFILFGLYSIHRSTWAEAYPYQFFWEIEVL